MGLFELFFGDLLVVYVNHSAKAPGIVIEAPRINLLIVNKKGMFRAYCRLIALLTSINCLHLLHYVGLVVLGLSLAKITPGIQLV